MSKQQAALAHSWLSWLCLTPVTGQVLPPDRSAAFPQAASKVASAHVAPAQGSCNKSPCRELPSARCPAVAGCLSPDGSTSSSPCSECCAAAGLGSTCPGYGQRAAHVPRMSCPAEGLEQTKSHLFGLSSARASA